MSLVVFTSLSFSRPLSAAEVPERGLFVGQASFPQLVQRGVPMFGSRAQSDCHLDPRSGGTGSSLPFKPERTSKQLNYRDRDCGSEAVFVISVPDGYGKRTGRNARNPDGQNRHSTLQPRHRCSGSPAPGLHTGLDGGVSARTT